MKSARIIFRVNTDDLALALIGQITLTNWPEDAVIAGTTSFYLNHSIDFALYTEIYPSPLIGAAIPVVAAEKRNKE